MRAVKGSLATLYCGGKGASVEGAFRNSLLCSRNARPWKLWCKGGKSFLCSRSVRPWKGLARLPQSKTPTALAGWAMTWKRVRMHAQWEINQPPSLKR